jgi:hypothetical protein
MRFVAFVCAAVAAGCVAVSGSQSGAQAAPFYEETGISVEAWGTPSKAAKRKATRQYASKQVRTKASKAKRRTYNYATANYEAPRQRYAGVGPRPGRWCGWWMRTQLGGGAHLNVAWNWSKWGRPAGGPRVGAVVVWRGHVGMITGQASNGEWIVKSGNDGGRVRERARSVSGAVFRVA